MKIYTVDAFTSEPFKGNPAGVCILDENKSDGDLLNIAAEMNLSETAFLRKADEESAYNLRWFTPKVEVDLCGHATLASAHILRTEGYDNGSKINFYTRSGLLTAEFNEDKITIDLPAAAENQIQDYPELDKALGVKPIYTGVTEFHVLAELSSEEEVLKLKPDIALLSILPEFGIIVTAKSAKYDFISRFFAPSKGIPEDPVTGSAHCLLASYWYKKTGRRDFHAYQASERGGELFVHLDGGRVKLSGNAVTILKGELAVHKRTAKQSE